MLQKEEFSITASHGVDRELKVCQPLFEMNTDGTKYRVTLAGFAH